MSKNECQECRRFIIEMINKIEDGGILLTIYGFVHHYFIRR